MEELNQIEIIILHYLQGSITEDEMRTLNRWLSESHENKQLFYALKNVYALRKGGLFPEKEEMKQSWMRLHKKMKATGTVWHIPPQKIRKFYIGLLRYAAVGLLFVLLTLGIQYLVQTDKPVEYVELNVESTPSMSRLQLPDGTKVVLNASTKFTFPDRFEGNVREVFLDGEAFFEVTNNKEVPFVVRTDRQRITVLGTVFNVMDYSSDDYAVTTLVSGSVTIQPHSETEEPGKVHLLKPNQQAFFNKTSSEIVLSNVKVDLTRMWVNKIYHFYDEPIFRIMQRLEKFYGVRIIITDETLKNEKYTGTFPMDKKIEEILQIINNYNRNITYTINNDIITISTINLKK